MDPNEQDEIQEMASQSSSDADQDVTEAQEDTGAEVEAESSSATDEQAPDTLSIVQDVVGKEAEAGSSPEGEEAEAEQSAEDEEDAQEPDNEDYSDVPFNKHPRFRELLAKSKANEADAERYRNVEKFLNDSAMRPDEAADGLQIMALAKSNPVEAWNRIKPWVQQLATAAGAIVPPDLQERVQAGEMSLEMAQELSRARAGMSSAEQQRQFAAEQSQRQQAEATRQAAMNAADTWAMERQARDPNFDAKMNALQREIAFLQTQEGRPSDPAQVRAQLDKAYKAVNATFAPAPATTPQPAAQPKKAVKPVTGGQVAGKSTAEPRNTKDIIGSFVKVV